MEMQLASRTAGTSLLIQSQKLEKSYHIHSKNLEKHCSFWLSHRTMGAENKRDILKVVEMENGIRENFNMIRKTQVIVIFATK
jgi:hypothetical protein